MKKEIIIIICNSDGGGAEWIVKNLQNYENSNFILTKLFIDKINFSEFLIINYFFVFFKILKKILFSKKYINDFLIHTHLTKSFYLGVLIKLCSGVKIIHTEHNSYNKRRSFTLSKFIDYFFYVRYNKIICISKAVQENLILIYPSLSNTKVIDNGARLFSKKKSSSVDINNGLKLLSIGSLTKQKGFDLFIKNTKSFDSNLISNYTILGEGYQKNQLIDLSKNHNFPVILRGWQSNILNFLNDCDLLVIPSRWEGFGLVAIEALSTGTPILISNVEGLNQFYEFANLSVELFDINDSKDIKNKLIKLKENLTHNGQELSTEAVKISSKFSFKKMNSSYMITYEEILQ